MEAPDPPTHPAAQHPPTDGSQARETRLVDDQCREGVHRGGTTGANRGGGARRSRLRQWGFYKVQTSSADVSLSRSAWFAPCALSSWVWCPSILLSMGVRVFSRVPGDTFRLFDFEFDRGSGSHPSSA